MKQIFQYLILLLLFNFYFSIFIFGQQKYKIKEINRYRNYGYLEFVPLYLSPDIITIDFFRLRFRLGETPFMANFGAAGAIMPMTKFDFGKDDKGEEIVPVTFVLGPVGLAIPIISGAKYNTLIIGNGYYVNQKDENIHGSFNSWGIDALLRFEMRSFSINGGYRYSMVKVTDLNGKVYQPFNGLFVSLGINFWGIGKKNSFLSDSKSFENELFTVRTKQIILPNPDLHINVSCPDELNAGESKEIKIVVKNSGEGIAENVKVLLSDNLTNNKDLNYLKSIQIGNLYSNMERQETVSIKVSENIEKMQKAEIIATINEKDGFTATSKSVLYIKPKKQPEKFPPILFLEAKLSDPNNNNLLDAGETIEIQLLVKNIGKGNAWSTGFEITTSGITNGINLNKSFIDIKNISPGKAETTLFNISANKEVGKGEICIHIIGKEANGFDPAPFELKIATQAFRAPKLILSDIAIFDNEGPNSYGNNNGIIERNETVEVNCLIQNIGQGLARDVCYTIVYEDNNLLHSSGDLNNNLGDLAPGQIKNVKISFSVPSRYSGPQTLPIYIQLSESYGDFGGKFPLNLSLTKQMIKSQNIEIKGDYSSDINIEKASFVSDVDRDIPKTKVKFPKRIAFIIGNEDYQSFQKGLVKEQNVTYALNDARIFKQYAINILGVEEKNVFLEENVTSGALNRKIEIIEKLLNTFGTESELIFYYAGHGLPDEKTKEPYIIPVDVSAQNISSGISLFDIYKRFANTSAARVVVFIDACFTGGSRQSGLLAARTVTIKPNANKVMGNILIFSATTEIQTALSYKEKQHGMFTYFLFKYLKESCGDITLGNLAENLSHDVTIESLRINESEQTPVVIFSEQVSEIWKKWNLVKK